MNTHKFDDGFDHCDDPCGYRVSDFDGFDCVLAPRDTIRALNILVALKAQTANIEYLKSPECTVEDRTAKIADALDWHGTHLRCLDIVLQPGTRSVEDERYLSKWHDTSGFSAPKKFFDQVKREARGA